MTLSVIDDELALAAFRDSPFSAGALAPIIQAHSVTLIDVPVGVGKSALLDNLVDHFEVTHTYDLIIVLSALTATLSERRLVRNPRTDVRRLRPRPRADCGPLDAAWRAHERNGTTAYAREHLCRSCPHFGGCFWPGQYGTALKGIKVIFATHQHLLISSRFLLHLRSMTGAERLLLLLDEAHVLAAPFRTTLAPAVLERFVAAVRRADLPEDARRLWVERTALLAGATTADLHSPAWSFPLPPHGHAVAIQEAGLADDPNFRWPGHDLYAFARARAERRWRDQRGNIVFVRTPYLAERTAIFSAGMPAEYVARQLGTTAVVAPFAAVECQHRDTKFYNICSLIGAAARFRRNYRQILDFFAHLILRNIAAGRSTLLVARKRFKAVCANYLERRLARWGCPVTVIPSDGAPPAPTRPTILPLIHYGINGVNSFESYEAAYCLCGFYIDEEVLRAAIADVEPDMLQFPVAIRVVGRPPRRRAGTFDDRFRASDADRIARAYYHQHETKAVVQAVGRVRFATRPREVITFQCSELPDVRLAREFFNLREARAFFGLVTGSEFDRLRQGAEARRLRAEGLTAAAIAARLGVSVRTVRYRLSAARRRDG
jgi:hypothetical protein